MRTLAARLDVPDAKEHAPELMSLHRLEPVARHPTTTRVRWVAKSVELATPLATQRLPHTGETTKAWSSDQAFFRGASRGTRGPANLGGNPGPGQLRDRVRSTASAEGAPAAGATRPGSSERARVRIRQRSHNRQLTERFHVHRTTVISILDRHDTPRRYRLLAGDALHFASELYAAGMSLAEVGSYFGFDASTVQRTFKREGIPRRDSSGRSSPLDGGEPSR